MGSFLLTRGWWLDALGRTSWTALVLQAAVECHVRPLLARTSVFQWVTVIGFSLTALILGLWLARQRKTWVMCLTAVKASTFTSARALLRETYEERTL